MFHVGQKVVCIKKGEWNNGWGCEIVPVYGGIYTIRQIRFREIETGCDGLLLNEIINSPMKYANGFHEASFAVHQFRPLQERKTSIEIFERMLTPDKVPA